MAKMATKIDPLTWYSLSQAERTVLQSIGAECGESFIAFQKMVLPIKAQMSSTGHNQFNDSRTFSEVKTGDSFREDKERCIKHLESLQGFVDRSANDTERVVRGFIHNSWGIDGMEGAVALFATTVHKYTVLGLIEGFYMANENFGTYELRTDWGQASKTIKDLFQKDEFLTKNSILWQQLKDIADIADSLVESDE